MAAGTFGISLVVAFGVDELADELISDSNLDKKRKQRIRKKVAKDIKNHLIEKKSIMMDEFNETLEGQTKNADDIIDDALKTIKCIRLHWTVLLLRLYTPFVNLLCKCYRYKVPLTASTNISF